MNSLEAGSTTRSERGIALIMVLWIIVVLGVTATYFSRGVRQESYIVRNYREIEEARLLAAAGVHHALALLSHPTDEGMNVDHEYIDHYFSEIEDVSLGTGRYQVTVRDEESKIDINNATRDVIRELLTSLGLASMRADSISDAIVDWRDPDEDPLLNGAESAYYQSRRPPYSSKNADYYTLEELLMVRGVTRDLFYGDSSVTVDGLGLADCLTVYGRGKININTANRHVLESMPGVDEQSSFFLVEGREEIDYSPMSKREFIQYLQEVNPSEEMRQDYQILQRLIDTKSYHFTILSRGVLEDGVERWLKVVVYRTLLGSRVNLRILSWRELGGEVEVRS